MTLVEKVEKCSLSIRERLKDLGMECGVDVFSTLITRNKTGEAVRIKIYTYIPRAHEEKFMAGVAAEFLVPLQQVNKGWTGPAVYTLTVTF